MYDAIDAIGFDPWQTSTSVYFVAIAHEWFAPQSWCGLGQLTNKYFSNARLNDRLRIAEGPVPKHAVCTGVLTCPCGFIKKNESAEMPSLQLVFPRLPVEASWVVSSECKHTWLRAFAHASWGNGILRASKLWWSLGCLKLVVITTNDNDHQNQLDNAACWTVDGPLSPPQLLSSV